MEELTVVGVKQRYSAATWKDRIATCRSSGQSVIEWCAANSICCKTYYRWERKLLREAGHELSCNQHPQEIQQFTEIPQASCTADIVAVLHTDKISCELRQGITPEQLSAIVQGLASYA